MGPNVASSENVASKQCGAKMWLQAQMWWRLRNDGNVASNNVASKCGVKHKCGGTSENDRNVASNNVASKCGVRHKCGGSPKCGVKQCGVKMWRQTPPLPNCLPGNVSSKKVFSGRHKSATLNACALNVAEPNLGLQIKKRKEASETKSDKAAVRIFQELIAPVVVTEVVAFARD